MQAAFSLSNCCLPPSNRTMAQPDRSTGAQFAVHLHGFANAGAEKSLVSQRLTFAYIITHMSVIFPDGCDFLVSATPLVSYDPEVSTSGLPQGTPLLLQFANQPALAGDGYPISFPCHIPIDTKGSYIKLHLNNADVDTHHITATFTVTELRTEP